MIKEIRIQNFRALEDVTLKDLGRINLIGGKNGSGKTSVLEALWMFASPTYPDAAVRLAGFRQIFGLNSSNVFLDIFSGFDDDKIIEFEAKVGSSSATRKLRITLRQRRGLTDVPSNGFEFNRCRINARA